MKFIISTITAWLIITSIICQLNIIITFIIIENYTNLFKSIEFRRGACKCGSTTHSRKNHLDCTLRKIKRRPEIESIQSPAQRQRISTPNNTDYTYLNSPLTLINRTIQSLDLNSTFDFISPGKILEIYILFL